MRIAVSGAGVAGCAHAYWLRHHGFEPVLIERAPRLRTAGYIIDFWGVGYDIVERMELLPRLLRDGYHVQEVRLVDEYGAQVGGFSADVFDRATNGRFVSLLRGDLVAAIHDALNGTVETVFDDSIAALDEHEDGVRVQLQSGASRDFDLVIGADGLHSNVRRLRFPRAVSPEVDLGYRVAAFTVDGYRPRDELVYVGYSRPGQQAMRFALRGDRTVFMLVFTAPAGQALPQDRAAQERLLEDRFGDAGWECPAILDAMRTADDLYLDRVSQIRMERWSAGRSALVGDAAYCPSLLAGQGSAFAILGAYVLAGELARAGGNHRVAFRAYEDRLRDFIKGKQDAAARFAGAFAPRTPLGLRFRNLVTRLMKVPAIADLAVGRDLRDDIEVPEYTA